MKAPSTTLLAAVAAGTITFSGLPVQAQSPPPVSVPPPPSVTETTEVDVVFIVDESSDMEEYHETLAGFTGSIFNELDRLTGGNFRVGLVGFGARPDRGDARKLATLTNNEGDFADAVGDLDSTIISFAMPGFEATIETAEDDIGETSTNDGTKMDGTQQGLSFPASTGFCAVMITDNPNSGDESAGTVAEALQQAGDSLFTGFVPADETMSDGNTYGRIASITGGIVGPIETFDGSNDSAALLRFLLSVCTQTAYSNAGCEPNGPYDVTADDLPATLPLEGNPTCDDDEMLINTEWDSSAPEVSFPDPDNPSVALVSAFGEYQVCQTTVCFDPMSNTMSRPRCCTTLALREQAPDAPTPAPILIMTMPPVSTDQPSMEVTEEPSAMEETEEPTMVEETSSPSADDTSSPSAEETSSPSTEETSSPSMSDSTMSPSSSGSTMEPSNMETTDSPSLVDTTEQPSGLSSDFPSEIPSLIPSIVVSDTLSPSQLASASDEPSNLPTILETTVEPTNAATTEEPSMQPILLTEEPTLQPISSLPTGSPTVQEPMIIPTTSPTRQPVLPPTGVPTMQPILVITPTEAPVPPPTLSPSSMPFPRPTLRPTLQPFPQPTTAPITPPTGSPSLSPVRPPTPKPTPRPRPTPSPSQLPRPPTSPPTKKPTPVATRRPTPKPSPSLRMTFEPTLAPTMRMMRGPYNPTNAPVDVYYGGHGHMTPYANPQMRMKNDKTGYKNHGYYDDRHHGQGYQDESSSSSSSSSRSGYPVHHGYGYHHGNIRQSSMGSYRLYGPSPSSSSDSYGGHSFYSYSSGKGSSSRKGSYSSKGSSSSRKGSSYSSSHKGSSSGKGSHSSSSSHKGSYASSSSKGSSSGGSGFYYSYSGSSPSSDNRPVYPYPSSSHGGYPPRSRSSESYYGYQQHSPSRQHQSYPHHDGGRHNYGGVVEDRPHNRQHMGGHQQHMGGHQQHMGGHQPYMGGQQQHMGGHQQQMGGGRGGVQHYSFVPPQQFQQHSNDHVEAYVDLQPGFQNQQQSENYGGRHYNTIHGPFIRNLRL